MRGKGQKEKILVLLLSFCLVLVTPIGEVWAAPEEIPIIKEGESCTLKYGDYACLAFTLPENEPVKAELYYVNGMRLGTLYGFVYEGNMRRPSKEQKLPDEWTVERETEILAGMKDACAKVAYRGLYCFLGIAEPENGLPQGTESNYLVWKGQYIPLDKQYPRYAQPGRYQIQISPLKPSCSMEPVFLDVIIAGSGMDGVLTMEDVERIQKREVESFPQEPIQVVDLYPNLGKGFVDMQDRTLWWKEIDLPAEEQDELKFERTYHSQGIIWKDEDLAGLGMRWTHNYSYYAELYRRDIVIFIEGNKQLSFRKLYGGGWDASNNYAIVMGEDCFWLYEPDGKTITFDLDGRAIQITNPEGQVINLEYEGKLLSRVSEGDKYLSFTYEGDRLVRVEDQKGRSASFQYEGEMQKDLVSVQYESGDTLRYLYGEKHCLVEAINVQGESEMEAVYGSWMEVACDREVLSFWMQGDSRKTYTYEKGENRTTITTEKEEGGRKRIVYFDNTYYEKNAWFLYNENGELIRETELSGKTTLYFP
ncbi:hypothetical protein D5278_13960 [bacterium 1XD21-13]|nr:hypothetical protein [bacterium 1XD21-13]